MERDEKVSQNKVKCLAEENSMAEKVEKKNEDTVNEAQKRPISSEERVTKRVRHSLRRDVRSWGKLHFLL